MNGGALPMNRRQALTLFAGIAVVGSLPTCTATARAAYGATLDTLPADSGLPDTERGRVVWAYKTGGRLVRAGAAAALTGSAADVTAFLAEGLPVARAEDNRAAMFSALDYSGRVTRAAIGDALEAGDSAVSAFLTGGFATAVHEDLRAMVLAVLDVGGTVVARRAAEALENGSSDALREFLDVGQYTAQDEDDRAQVFTILSGASPQVEVYAERALTDGSPGAIRGFLDSGQHIARAFDEEAATIAHLVGIVKDEQKRAARYTKHAVLMSEKAEEAAAATKAAALEARAEAEAAEADVRAAARAATKAAKAARGAAEASSIAVGASRTAQSAARRAAGAAQSAAAYAASAGQAAANAYRAAIAASADRSQAAAARAAADKAAAWAAMMPVAEAAANAAEIAAGEASTAGAAAARAASNAADAAYASARAAEAAGAAQAEVAEARQAAAEADAAASLAERAADTAQSLANRARTAAREARVRARSAGEHCQAAAAAAREAADRAWDAAQFAQRSQAAADAAVQAATAALEAVEEARTVEAAAREAEVARLAVDKEAAITIARVNARVEAEVLELARREQTWQSQYSEDVLALITAAESALQGGSVDEAIRTAREAMVKIVDPTASPAAWTRAAAEYALAGTDEDVINWVSVDRGVAQFHDDRMTVASIGEASTDAVRSAALTVLQSDNPEEARAFIEQGVVHAAAEDNRARVLQILGTSPGPAVQEAAEAALNDGSAGAFKTFFTTDLPEAVRADDTAETFRILDTGGMYTQAAAEVALEGTHDSRRRFVTSLQFQAALLDHDRETHVNAIRASINRAADLANMAMRDAAKAVEAARIANDAQEEAQQWARRASDSYEAAQVAKAEAQRLANLAARSATAAQESATTAKTAAAAAREASVAADRSVWRALRSAGRATAHAWSARASATAAYADAVAAGQDASGAADAANRAWLHAVNLAVTDFVYALTHPAPEDSGDSADPLGLIPKDVSNPRDWAYVTDNVSAATGGVSFWLSWVPPIGVGAPAAGIGGALGTISTVAGLGNIIARAQYTDYHSAEMKQAIGSWAIGAAIGTLPYPESAVGMLHGDPVRGRWRSVFKTLTGFEFDVDHPIPDMTSRTDEIRVGEGLVWAYDGVSGFLGDLVD
ncbi:ALF repeat-containing protein [Promicromonospora sp. MS192]|uniref:ALF repeat-containing protein n=1 Tax=Promicromonospora sp. MS192 TaxID=3412684 RepID=UPI003C2FA402